MGLTISGPLGSTYLPQVAAPLVYVKQEFGDGWTYAEQSAQFGARFGKDWTLAPDLICDSCSVHAAGQDLDTAVFRRPYGQTQHEWQTRFDQKTPYDLRGWWVAIMFGEYLQSTRRRGTSAPHWLGQISNSGQEVYSPESGDEAGMQYWTAYGPRQQLRLRDVHTSHWYNADAAAQPQQLAWLPPMNLRDRGGLMRGNRSTNLVGGTYVYGGTALWSHLEYLRYILAYYAGPQWYIGGQFADLANMVTVIQWPSRLSVDDILRRLIPIENGYDYTIRWRNAGAEPGQTWNAGWEVNIFRLLDQPSAFGRVTIPANPNRVEINLGDIRETLTARIVPTGDHLYSKVIVHGKRLVVCCSLNFGDGSLEEKWTDQQRIDYKQAGGESDPDRADARRRDEKWRHVYRFYGAPANWDPNAKQARPVVASFGTVLAYLSADWQNVVRRTLSWLPLQENFDYTTNPPTYYGPVGQQDRQEQLPPAAYILDRPTPLPTPRYVLAEEVGLSVSIPKNEWGIIVRATPNHLLALNHWPEGPFDPPTSHYPLWDYKDLVATIAFESDQRAGLGYQKASTTDGPWKILEVRDAELWWLCPNTVVGTDANGNLVTSGGLGIELRNDLDLLQYAMAGAIARYTRQRWRANLTFAGLHPWQELVGQILVVDDGFGTVRTMNGPVTTIAWGMSRQQPTTTIKAGFAK